MNEHITRYIDELFQDTPQTGPVREMREELLGNLHDKYDDLTAQGATHEDAMKELAAGIGDLDSLISQLKSGDLSRSDKASSSRTTLFFLLGALALVVGLALFYLLLTVEYGTAAVVFGSILLVISVACFVYGSWQKQPEPYQKEDDSFVEEYKVKYTTPSKNTRLRGAASGLLWTVVVLVYFLLSFTTNEWGTTWVIFLGGAVLQQVISAIFSDKKRAITSGMIYTTSVILYLIISFGTDLWHLTWLIFIAAVAVEQAMRFIRIWREE